MLVDQSFNMYNLPAQCSGRPILQPLAIFDAKDNLHRTCKYFFDIDLSSDNLLLLQALINSNIPMISYNDEFIDHFTLSLYAMLRVLITPNCRIVIFTSTFREAKNLFQQFVDLYNGSEVLQNIKSLKLRRDIDRCHFGVGGSEVVFMSCGDGNKLRGLPVNYLIADNNSAMMLVED